VRLSIVIPVFNEEENLPLLYQRLTDVCSRCADEWELLFIDDGSQDKTMEGVKALAAKDPGHVRYLALSRNFGQEMAMIAGLDHCVGDAVVLIDADLQDPPELIADMIERWKAGAHVVYAQRIVREGETFMKKLTSKVFYRVISKISEVDIPKDTGHFRLMDRRVADEIIKLRESPRYTRGLVSWVGFTQECVQYRRHPRHAGKTGFNYRKMIRLAAEAITSFSVTPLYASVWFGLGMVGVSVLATLIVILEKLFFNPNSPRGIAFLTCGLFFMGGVQLFILGMIGIYVGQIFKNVQGRPMYIVAERSESLASTQKP
jgi:polyisoprenyl-phosphate glycosyltransferase